MGMFDDLIPQNVSRETSAALADPRASSGSSSISFEDLIPKTNDRDYERLAKIAGSSGAKGMLSTLGMPGDFADLIGTAMQRHVTGPLFGMFDRIVGNEPKPLLPPNNPLSSKNLLSYGRSAGMVDNPDLAPRDRTERYTAAGAEGVGSALPFGLPGGLPMLGRAGVQGLAGGLTGEAAAEAVPAYPNAARATGNIVGGIVGNTAVNVGSRAFNAMAGNEGPTLSAYREAEVTPRLAGDVTGRRGPQWMQATGEKLPGGGGITQATEDTVRQFGESVQKRASMLGSSTTPQQAGEMIQKAGEDWLNKWKGQSTAAWNSVGMHIPKSTRVSITNYDAALSDATRAMPDAAATAKTLQGTLPRQLAEALAKDADTAGTLSWESVAKARSLIGEKLANPQLVADASTADLKRIYAGLTKDMETAAAARGPQAMAAFSNANAVTRAGHEFIDTQLSKLMGEGIAPERAYAQLMGGANTGGTRLADVRAQMPSAVDEAAAAKLLDMVTPSAGQQTDRVMFSPARFRTEWEKLSPEAQSALFAHPEIRAKVNALATVAGTMKDSARRLNTSQTTPAAAWMSVLGAPVAGAAGYSQGGLPGAAAGTAAALSPLLAGLAARGATATPLLTKYLATPFASQDQSALARFAPMGGLLAPRVRGLLEGGP